MQGGAGALGELSESIPRPPPPRPCQGQRPCSQQHGHSLPCTPFPPQGVALGRPVAGVRCSRWSVLEAIWGLEAGSERVENLNVFADATSGIAQQPTR